MRRHVYLCIPFSFLFFFEGYLQGLLTCYSMMPPEELYCRVLIGLFILLFFSSTVSLLLIYEDDVIPLLDE